MAGDKGSEERKFPPTLNRLKRLRREGMAPIAADFRQGLSIIFGVIVILASFGAILKQFQQVMTLDLQAAFAMRDVDAASGMTQNVILLAPLTVALLSTPFLTYLLAALIEAQGFIFSTKAFSLDFGRLNPIEGIGKRFGVNASVEFLRNVIKATLIGAAVVFIGRRLANDILWAPVCGLDCIGVVALAGLVQLFLVLCIVQFLAGLVDLRLSRVLFNRDNRMSHSEMKRDRKDIEGDPLIKKARSAKQKTAATTPVVRELRQANVVIWSDAGAVAMLVHPQFEHAPVIVIRKSGQDAVQMRDEASALKIPLVYDQVVIESLKRAPMRGEIPPSSFTAVARALVSARIL